MSRLTSMMGAACALAVVSGPVLAQTTPPPSQKERTEAFLSGRAQQQRDRTQKLGTAASGLQQLNGLVRAVNLRLPAPTFVDDPDQKRRLADAFLVDVSQELAMLGFTPGDVRAVGGNGQTLVEAASARVRGSATLRQHAVLADTVAVARVTGINASDDRGDGYLSTVTLSVVRPFSKGLSAGDTIELRRLSGQSATKKVESSIEEQLSNGDEILLLGSRAFYGNSTGKPGKASRTVVEISPFYRVNGDALVPSSPFQPAASLTEISAN